MPKSRAVYVVIALALCFAAAEARADLNITVSPNPVSIRQGEMGEITITSQILPGFPASANSIEYTLTNFPQGTGIGTATTFAPSFPPTNLRILVNSSTPPGTYTGTIMSVAKDAGGNVVGDKEFPAAVTVNVTPAPCDFQLMPTPASLRIDQGKSGQLEVFASLSGGCTGNFMFSATAPNGVMVDSPKNATAPNTRVTFTYATAATAPPGQYTSTITVQGGGVTKTIDVPIEVVAAQTQGDYSVSVMPNPISVANGGRQSFSFTITSINGFQGPVTVRIGTSGQVVVLDKNCAPGTFCPYLQTTYTVPANGSASDQAIASSTGPDGGTVVLITSTPGLPDKHTDVPVVPLPAADFRLNTDAPSLALVQGASRDVQISGSSINSFTGTVSVTSSAPAGLTIEPAAFELTLPGPKFSQNVRVTAGPNAPAGTYTLELTGTSGTLVRNLTMSVTVTPAAQPDFTISATAPTTPTVAGQNARVRVTAAGSNGFNSPITVTAAAAGGSVTPASFTLNAGESRDVDVTIAGTQGGNVSVTFVATGGGVQRSATVSVPFVTAAQPEFALSVSQPMPSTVGPFETATFVVTVSPMNGFNAPVSVTIDAPSLVATPAQFTLPAGTTSQTVQVRPAAGAPAGPKTITVTATSSSPSLTRTATTSLTTTAAGSSPSIDAITPPGAVAGVAAFRVAITGSNFEPGARVISSDPRIAVAASRAESSSVVIADLSVDFTTAVGAHELTVVNPDGGAAATRFLVYEEGDLAAPLGVTAAAILSPMHGKIIAMFDRPHAVGAVAATGTGTITGRWLLDGASFDQFAITVSGGESTVIMSRQPIPYAATGRHRLQLVIDAPQRAESAEVSVEMASESASSLTILGPVPTAGGEATSNEPLTLRWSIVPGALGYRVELEKNGQPFGEPIDVGQEAEVKLEWNQLASERDDAAMPKREWTAGTIPSSFELDEIRRSAFRWRVAPVYCCSGEDVYPGQRSEWAPLPVPAVIEPDVPLNDDQRLAAIVAAVTPELAAELSARGTPRIAQSTGAPKSTPANPQKSKVRKDWAITPALNASYNHQAEDEQASVQVSGRGDLGIAPFSSKYTTDFTGRDLLGDGFSFTGSRNWLINVGNAKTSKRAIRPELSVGYAPPRFFSGAQLVGTSMARGGALVSFGTKYGTASYYSSFTDELEGVIPGNFGMRQKVSAAAFELPAHQKYSLKLLHLSVEDLPDERQKTFNRGEGQSLGLYGTLNLSRQLQVTAEAARGEGEWETPFGVREREGNAFRVGLNGMRNRLNWRADVSRTDSEFSKPGDRFSTMALPNRTIGSLTLSSPVGKGQGSVTVRHQLQSKSETDSSASGINLSYNRAFTPRLMLSAGGNYNVDQGGGRAEVGLPKLDREQMGASVTLTETLGRVSLSQTFEHRQVRDGISQYGNNDTDMFTVSANGALSTHVRLSAMATASSMSGVSGDNDTVTFSLTPLFTIPNTGLSLQPRISWNLSSSSASDSHNRSEDYASVVQWAPEWFSRLGSFQLATNWRRGRSDSMYSPERRTMTREYVGTFTMRWGAGIGPATFRRGDQAATVPVAHQPGASQNPVNGRIVATGASASK